MKCKTLTAVAALAAVFLTSSSWAVTYNDTETAIFGAGNPNTGWTTVVDSTHNISISLRGKDRTTGDTSNANGLYSNATGLAQISPPRGRENVEFSLNASVTPSSQTLSSYKWFLAYDTDPTAGTSFSYIDLSAIPDNAYGTSSTANGGGTVGLWATYSGIDTIAQNSEPQNFLGVNPLVPGIYDYEVFATSLNGSTTSPRLDQVDIQIQLGRTQGVPDRGATGLMLGAGLVGLFALRRKLAL